MGELHEFDLAQSWMELYRGVLRLRAALEPQADSEEDTRFYEDFCNSLRVYLIDRCGVDVERLARVDIEASVEHENWDAVWSASSVALRFNTD